MICRSLLLCCSLLCSFLLEAQTLVHIRVQAAEGPLPGATVMLGRKTGITDSAGLVSLPAEKEKQVLQVTMVGYEPVRRIVMASEAEIALMLQPAQSSLNEVVITGTSRPVLRENSPIAVEVYTPQFFRKNPAPSLFESLQNVNGVRPQINCSVCNTGDIHINGLEGPYTMITIDGMPIVSSLSTVYGLFGIPQQLIERLEVIKGPASGLYGSEAIGGLINIITKNPEKAPKFTANVMATSWKEYTADLGTRFRFSDKLYSLLGLHYFNYSDPTDKNGDGFTDVTLQHRVSVFNKWTLKRRDNRLASLAARYFYEDRWGGDVRWSKRFRGGRTFYGESIYTDRWELLGAYQLPVPGQLYLTASATWHHQDSYYGNLPYLGDQQIFFGQLKWDKTLSARHDLVVGLAGRYQYYDDNSTATQDTMTLENRPDRTFLPGLFVQDEWKIGKDQALLVGLRADHHPVHKLIFTPRVAYKWTRNAAQVWRINAGTGFRVVNLFTEDHAALTGSRAVVIEEKLEPERSYNLNLNLVQKLGGGPLQFTIDASVWYTYFHNQIIADYSRDPKQIVYSNLKGHAVSRGLTLNTEFSLRQRFKGMAGITLQDVAKYEPVNGKEERVRPMFTESWSGTWSLSYSFPLAGLTVDYTGNVYGPMQLPLLSALDPRRPESPVWSIQNIQLTKWISQGLEIYAGVKNLLNWTPNEGNPFLIARTQDPFNKEVEYNADGSVKATPDNPYALTFDPAYVYAPNQGIRLFTGLRLHLK